MNSISKFASLLILINSQVTFNATLQIKLITAIKKNYKKKVFQYGINFFIKI